MAWSLGTPEPTVVCSFIKPPAVQIELIPRRKIELLMQAYPNLEWLAYLVGKMSKKLYLVKDISVPPHEEASGGSCLAAPFHIPDRCIGIIHSHHHMGAFHSGTDANNIDRNYLLSIVVAYIGASLGYNATVSCKTPCGKLTVTTAQVSFVQLEPVFDRATFQKEACANIDKGIRTVRPYTSGVRKEVFCRPDGLVVDSIDMELLNQSAGRVLSIKEQRALLRELK